MTIADLQAICVKLPGVTEDIKWDVHLCFNVGNKMFLITSPDDVPVTASFKTDEEGFENLTAKEGIKPSPYLAKHKWIHVDNIRRLTKKEWEFYIKLSYRLIAMKLPVKIKNKLSL